ncbi:Canalicular multispecific organic anion transporter 2 [Mortierella sp. AM989]|nr:Canalicular multispecific organic anion transporter 2 [Mortierella sp. AM989]
MLWTSSIALYILTEDDYQYDGRFPPFKLLLYFVSAIAVAFFFEALPRGATRPLTSEDLINTTPKKLLTNVNCERLIKYWEQDKMQSASKNKQPWFIWTVIRSNKQQSLITLGYCLAGFGSAYVPPLLFGQLLRFFDDYSKATRDNAEPPAMKIGFIISAAILFIQLASTVLHCLAFHANADLGAQTRAATVALIYRKSLVLSPQARQLCTLGEITNHMAVDAEQWLDSTLFLILLITIPLEISLSIFLLYRVLGWSLLVGLGVFVFLLPIQAKMASYMNGYKNEHLNWMDNRLRLIMEALSNIKIIKLYHWETPFRQKIDALRAKELGALKGVATIHSAINVLFNSVSLLMAFSTFWAYAYFGGPNMTPGKMTSEVVFVSIALFATMSRPLALFAHAVSQTIAINVAMKRVQKFLLMEEIDATIVRRYSRQPHPSSPGNNLKQIVAVDIENGTFMWEKPIDTVTADLNNGIDGEQQPLLAVAAPQPTKPTLSNITLRVLEGNLTAIVGRIGQGKSSLLSAIMGEMYKSKVGTVTVYGDLAYVPQQAWIINATVRDNILFGKPFDQTKYDQIIYATGLQPDLEILPAGDQTEIGERGINLSGGQKQRVSLARAVYQDADIYLLDDPLSAVDAHVDQHLWKHLIGPEGLLKDKTRLLVTHGIHHLEHVDQIVVLKDGSISEEGEYQQLMEARGPFYQLIKDFSVGKKKSHSQQTHHNDQIDREERIQNVREATNFPSSSGFNGDSEGELSERNTIVESVDAKDSAFKVAGNDDLNVLIADEKMEVGGAGWKIALIYAKAA